MSTSSLVYSCKSYIAGDGYKDRSSGLNFYFDKS